MLRGNILFGCNCLYFFNFKFFESSFFQSIRSFKGKTLSFILGVKPPTRSALVSDFLIDILVEIECVAYRPL